MCVCVCVCVCVRVCVCLWIQFCANNISDLNLQKILTVFWKFYPDQYHSDVT